MATRGRTKGSGKGSSKSRASGARRAAKRNGSARRVPVGVNARNGRAPRGQEHIARAKEQAAPVATRSLRNPLAGLRQEIDRIFDDFAPGFPRLTFGRRGEAEPLRRFQGMLGFAAPAVDLVEKEREFQITAELPGLDEGDFEVLIGDGVLTIRGRKREHREERKGETYVSERRYGSFHRSFQMPADVDPQRIHATFQKGVLAISLPKLSQSRTSQRKIAVRAR
jgi:HSP20 family protein